MKIFFKWYYMKIKIFNKKLHYKLKWGLRRIQGYILYHLAWFNSSKIREQSCYLIPNDIRLFEYTEIDRHVIDKYFEHRFDLLGSGWIFYNHKSHFLGRFDNKPPLKANSRNSEESLLPRHNLIHEKLKKLISKNYQPINWHCDQVSGFTWSPKELSQKALSTIGKLPGVDIKQPWELSRLQHLPFLAQSIKHLDEDMGKKLCLEINDQILDFLINNPLGMGVNWACPMDVAIRVSNIICTYWMIKSQQGELSSEFEEILINYITLHRDFILRHIEYNSVRPENNNNHYLSNLSGILFSCIFLNDVKSMKIFHKVSLQFLDCIDHQFNDDGSNFEASTSYHRLSSELVIYPVALILGWKGRSWTEQWLGQDRILKIYKMGKFTEAITKPNGDVIQIGDNDSGRYFKLDLVGELITNKDAESKYLNLKGYCSEYGEPESYWDQRCLNHQSFSNAVSALFGEAKPMQRESSLVGFLTGDNTFDVPDYNSVIITKTSQEKIPKNLVEIQLIKAVDPNLNFKDISCTHFGDFGVTVYANSHFHLAVYHGGVGGCGGGHSHENLGSIELYYQDNVDIHGSGTYLYTSDHDMRKLFRSCNANNGFNKTHHFSSSFSGDLKVQKENILTEVSKNRFRINVLGIGERVIILRDNYISIYGNEGDSLNYNNKYYSAGYGKIQYKNTH